MGEDFDYAKEFNSLDLAAVKKDIAAVMTDPRIGGRRILETMVRFSFAWPGTAPAPTGWGMAAAGRAGGSSVSPR